MDWKPIDGFAGEYEVSEHGDIRSCRRYVPSMRHPSGVKLVRERVLRPFVKRSGHLAVKGVCAGKPFRFSVHRVVARAFLGPCPDGEEVRHKDGDPSNNHYSNLCYGTRAQNVADAIAHGTFTRGERNGASKLRNVDVEAIKSGLRGGARGVDLASAYNISQQAICDIKNGRNWAHIPSGRGI